MESPLPEEIDTALPPAEPRRGNGLLPGFTSLDPRVVPLWRLDNAVGYAFLLLPSAAFLLFLYLKRAAPIVWPYLAAAWGLLALWSIFATLRLPALSYVASGYRLEERVLLIKRGIWWQTIQFLPLSRLQHVDLNRGPFERRYGLASLVLHTAGTHAASLHIPGLDADEAVRLRDHLIATGAEGDDAV